MKTTRKVIVEGLLNASSESIEREKERDDALAGLPAIRKAVADKQIMLPTAAGQ